MRHLISDVRFALRSWRRSVGLIAAAIVAIGLGVAANTTIFSFVSAVLLRGLPYPDPGRVVVVWQDFTRISGLLREGTSPGLFLEWQRRSGDALSAIAVVRGWAPALVGVAEPERFQGAAVSGRYFEILGATAARGRLLNAQDDVPGAPTVVVISHGLWTRRFGQDPSIIGTVLTLDQEPATVVGVTAPDFEPALLNAEIWSATRIPPGAPIAMVVLRAIGRVRPDISVAVAQERMAAVARQLDEERISEEGAGIMLEPLHEEMTGPVRIPLLVLMVSVALVLLIACLNVALLLLARASARTREVTLRAALGASRTRLLAQLLTETLLLAVAGTAIGLLVTFFLLDSIRAIAPPAVPRLGHVQLDARVLLFTAGLTCLTTIIGGLLPALVASRIDLMGLLREGGSESAGTRTHRALVVAEVALAVALLTGAGQILRSFDKLQRVDLGFDPRGLVATNVGLPRARYQSDERIRQFYDRVLERLQTSPAVSAVGLVSVLPLSGADADFSFRIEGRPLPTERSQEPVAWFRLVSEDYFRTLSIRIEEGRSFAKTDTGESPCVVLVNRVLAEQYWPDGSALGARIFAGQSCEVAGIVANVHHRGPATPPEAEMYLSFRQQPLRGPGASIVARAVSDSQAAATALRTIIRSEDPAIPPGTLRTLDDMLGRTLAQPRFMSVLTTGFALVALALALIGVHGLLSYAVERRTREIGVRMAVGADRRDVARLIAAGSAWTILSGAAAGLAGSFALSRGLTSVLFEIEPGDPLTAVGVLVLVITAGIIATVMPARRAMRLNPQEILR